MAAETQEISAESSTIDVYHPDTTISVQQQQVESGSNTDTTIDVYHYDSTLHVFNSMPRRSSVSYNAMMSGYLCNGIWMRSWRSWQLGTWVWLQVCVFLLHGAFGLDLAAEVVEVVAVDDGCRFQAKRINELTQDIQTTTTKKKAENQIDAERLRTMAEKKAEN
ncbi:hypothetical protein LWI29_012697 [Acer saccharum]|uniref:Uncharacterized protein n=1 Tax=Acer saccharum TaxID=4024 RepID=A0AA39SM15_ACESA|nr:hypothetical protein LWI29_012697 [Acer saccharum]